MKTRPHYMLKEQPSRRRKAPFAFPMTRKAFYESIIIGNPGLSHPALWKKQESWKTAIILQAFWQGCFF